MASGWLTKDLRAAIYRRDRCACAYCGRELHVGAHNSDPAAASLDHVKARVSGGDLRNPRNLVAVCASCNSSKGSTPLATWCKARGLETAAVRAEINRRINRVVK